MTLLTDLFVQSWVRPHRARISGSDARNDVDAGPVGYQLVLLEMSPSEESFSADDLVPVSVWRLVVSEEGGEESIVILKEQHGETLLPIAIGFCEAAAIRQLVDEKMDRGMTLRPLAHELLVTAIEGLRARVERGIITRLDHGTFFACLVLKSAAGEFRLDARPSDVICSTLAAGCSLYVLRQLLEEVSGDPDP